MKPTPRPIDQYYVFLASPGDVGKERQHVRRFFDEYNRHTAHVWNVRFEVVDWENYASVGVGRPQGLITEQTLEKYRDSLALVIGVMDQRFGSPTGEAESGTEEEFDWAMESQKASGFPEIKWFFRKRDRLELPSDPDEAEAALSQWRKVRAFRERMQNLDNPVFYAEYPDSNGFAKRFDEDLNRWLSNPARPWASRLPAGDATVDGPPDVAPPAEFDAESYQAALLKRFDNLNFEMLDTTGAFYNEVRLWSVFVPQSVRECHQYNPRLLEIPKEYQRRLLDAGEITAQEIEEAERQADRLRQEYFNQPLRPVLDVVNHALRTLSAGAGRKLVMLGDPGSGKSSLIRYLAVRWATTTEPGVRDAQPIPLVIELGAYARWHCDGRKDFVRYLEEGPVWHAWKRGQLAELLKQPGRAVLLLDGLDEIFDVSMRESVINDIQRFSSRFVGVPILLTSRVVGYQAQRLRETGFQHFMLQDLDPEQVAEFVDRWHEVTFSDPEQAAPKRDRLKKAVLNSKSIAMLAGNPLLLTMMAILNRHQELPRDRADLYEQASRVLLHQWDTERALASFPGMSDEVGLREKTDILRRIAAHMQATPDGLKGNLIYGATLTDLIEEYLRDELKFTQARAAARVVVEHLRQRNFILCFVGADSYAFVHRTFLEYFCAADFVYQFSVSKTMDIDGLIALFDQHCREDEWREVLRLICGQIDDGFVGQIIRHLSNRTDLKIWDGDELPEIPLAIECFSEVRNIARMESTGLFLIETLLPLYIPGAGSWWFHERLLDAQQEVGTRWPGAESLFDTIREREREIREERLAGSYLPKFLACVRPHRQILLEMAKSDRRPLRAGAFEALSSGWPDAETRELLTRHAVEDEDSSVRGSVLGSLASGWPDAETRELLTRRVVEDEDTFVRLSALGSLASGWPDAEMREWLKGRVVEDEDSSVRRSALRSLASGWPDAETREWLTRHAVEDEDSFVRLSALRSLASGWPDAETRELLTGRVVEDEDSSVRGSALGSLESGWPDAETRELLTRHAVEDEDSFVRGSALGSLASGWPDAETRELLAGRVVEDEDVGGVAAFELGRMHSRFGYILMTKDLDGTEHYINPCEPIPQEHIETAAARSGVAPEELDDQVVSLSEFLGWDITVGAKRKAE